MLDVVNERLIAKGDDPIAFDHDCREGICGTCGVVVNGRPHGPRERTTACQLHMRSFRDGDVLTIYEDGIVQVGHRYACSNKIADRVDGYDRDDLAESPDY